MLRGEGLSRIAAIVRMAGAGWFVVSASHALALLLVPALMPICTGSGAASSLAASGPLAMAIGAVGAHAVGMLAVAGLVAGGARRATPLLMRERITA